MKKDIERAIDALHTRRPLTEKYERYYNGDHDLRFATEKFENTFGKLFREFALNLCPIICDAVKDKLLVKGFSVESSPHLTERVDAAVRDVWSRNRMAIRSGEVHKEALRQGDGFVLVWPDVNRRPCIYPQHSAGIAVFYEESRPDTIEFAAKCWLDGKKHTRLNLFYPDRTERYISRMQNVSAAAEVKDMMPAGPAIANPYGRVPLFHFANNSEIGSAGRSELEAALPIQDGLNKAVLDMLVAMEFAAFRQRWAAGIEVEYDSDGNAVAPFTSGVDSLWIAGDPSARFGDFQAAELEQFLKVKEGFRVDIATVTGTPLHYFVQDAAAFPSGESLRQASARFIAKVLSRQLAYGQVWADVMSFALAIQGIRGTRLVTLWQDPSPLSERERLQILLLKKQLGIPRSELVIEAGYGAEAAKGEPS